MLVCSYFLLRDFGLNGIIFTKVCVLIKIAIAVLLKDFGPYEIIFLTTRVYYCRFSLHS